MPSTMRRVLLLDALEIGRRSAGVSTDSRTLWRGMTMAAEIGEEARELRVAGGLGDGAMEGEILRRPRPRRARCARSMARSAGDLASVCAGGRVRRQAPRPRPRPPSAQLHDVEHVAQRAECAASRCGTGRGGIVGDIGAEPWRVITSPSARSAATASRTTVRLTPMAASAPARSAAASRARACRW